ncbi:MAG: hypothetical protein II811_08790, partial [Spirochaetaceae bacterium]|nr:hypothetical protein [Spirochaetaceae bacterium]
SGIMKYVRNLVLAAFFALVSVSFFSCGDSSSSKFLKDYEKFVISAEKSAENKATGKLDNLAKKEAEFAKKATKIEMSVADAGKFAVLSARWTAAEAKLSALKVKDEAGKAAEKTGSALKELGGKLKK